jgi:hypothetical protein
MTDTIETTRNRGGWMQTFTGRQFYPLDPRPEDIDVFDIAHALGYQCRYGGHARRFYSVAEHCILMSVFMPTRELALYALLHDAAEAYVVDVPRPLKRHLAGYAEIEDKVLTVIFEKLGVPYERHQAPLGHHRLLRFPAEVTEADNRILMDERAQLLSTPPAPWALELEPLGIGIDCLPPHRAAEAYLARLESLGVEL